MSTHLRRTRLRKQTSICPFDETVGLLKGGLQKTPNWFNSVRKYPPEQMWMRAGRMPRPAEFYRDRNRRIMNLNETRPDWVPALQFDNVGMQTADAFSKEVQGFNPDVEFAACQSFFMKRKGMDEEEAYEQARFKMRDLTRQKQRVWEVFHRFKYGQSNQETLRHADMWIDQLDHENSDRLNEEGRENRRALFERIREKGLKKHQVRMKLATSMKARVELTEKLRAQIIDEREKLEEDEPPRGRKWAQLEPAEKENYIRDQLVHNQKYRDEHAYIWDRETEREVQLNRFIEICDYIGHNKSSLGPGVKDPTEYLEGIEDKEHREALMNEMARRMLPATFDPETILLEKKPPRVRSEQDDGGYLLKSHEMGDGRDDQEFRLSQQAESIQLRPVKDYKIEWNEEAQNSSVFDEKHLPVLTGEATQLKLKPGSTLCKWQGALLVVTKEGSALDLHRQPLEDSNGRPVEVQMVLDTERGVFEPVVDERTGCVVLVDQGRQGDSLGKLGSEDDYYDGEETTFTANVQTADENSPANGKSPMQLKGYDREMIEDFHGILADFTNEQEINMYFENDPDSSAEEKNDFLAEFRWLQERQLFAVESGNTRDFRDLSYD